MSISSLPGFRDFYPDEMAVRSHIFRAWREVAGRYGFVEYDGPPLEPLELYTRKSGEEIVSQLYGFSDRGGREVALRPEMTPTLARMVAARAGGLPKPIRWFAIPQLFRYERPQKGRLREHFQLNLDIVGDSSPSADVEVVAAAVDSLRAFGLGVEDFVARYSDRQLVSAVLERIGVPAEGLERAFAALDKQDRETDEWVTSRLVEAGATPDAADAATGLAGSSLDELEERFADDRRVAASASRLREFENQMAAAGLAEYIRFDATLVRGLAYYTGLVFELWDVQGSFRAICGGGRYDRLLQAVGGPDLPAVGFGMGDVVLAELLRDRGLLPEPGPALDDFVIFVTDDEREEAIRIVHALRTKGRRAGFDLRGRGVGRQFKAAHQAGAERAIVVGPDEIARGAVVVRHMGTGDERRVGLTDLLEETD
jgi:histidyl-tRNA synthetase